LKYQQSEDEIEQSESGLDSRKGSLAVVAHENTSRKHTGDDKSSRKSTFQKENEGVAPDAPKQSQHWFLRLMSDHKNKQIHLILGSFFAALMGACFVAQGYLLATIIEAMHSDDFSSTAYNLSIAYCFLAVFVFITILGRFLYLTDVGEDLVKGLRMRTLKKILAMPIEFFDLPENKTGAIASQLELNTGAVRRISGGVLGNFWMAFTGAGGAIAVAFYYNWVLALLLTAMSPLLIARALALRSQWQGFKVQDEKATKEAGALVSESVTNIRTVHSLNIEKDITDRYSSLVTGHDHMLVKQATKTGIMLGLGEFGPNLMYATAFFVGSIMIQNDQADILDVMIPLFVIISGVQTMGDFISTLPELAMAKVAVKKMYEFEDTPSKIDPNSPEGAIMNLETVRGDVEIRDVHFSYPTREEPVLNGINLVVSQGKTVALVGPSGCGKSTIISLVLRFYDPTQGKVFIDGQDISKINVRSLRNIMSLVSQEPILFNTSIRENIKYGCDDVSDEEMIKAAEKANARKFIESNEMKDRDSNGPEGYDRNVGLGGSKLSGGQKQRLAIARAIIRKPKILLLDEATSALDSQSESLVQEALNELMKGKSTIVIAHRISTIESADKIAVIREGKVDEEGNYSELMSKKGQFYSLAKALK